jgi:hypothetical protein
LAAQSLTWCSSNKRCSQRIQWKEEGPGEGAREGAQRIRYKSGGAGRGDEEEQQWENTRRYSKISEIMFLNFHNIDILIDVTINKMSTI